jgi:hypothetical protein
MRVERRVSMPDRTGLTSGKQEGMVCDGAGVIKAGVAGALPELAGPNGEEGVEVGLSRL